jgi:hypothetical protein
VTTNPTHRTRLARALADAAGIGYQKALSRVDEVAGAGLLPGRLDAAGMRQALEVLRHRTAAGAGNSPQSRALEPRYYRLAEVVNGRLRPGVPQKTAKAEAAGVLPLRSWGEFDPRGMADPDGIVTVAGGRGTDWWHRVAAAGPRPDCILPDPYQGRRGRDGSVPIDRALDERDARDPTGYSHRRYEMDLQGIVRREPRDVDAWAHFGNLRLDLADPATPQPLGAPEPQDRWRRSWTWTALGYYQAAVAIAELALPDPFSGFLRRGHLDNRPFFRALAGLALAFWALGQFDEAEQTLLNILWLSPGDDQGAGELLAPVRAQVRWEDYQRGDSAGNSPGVTSPGTEAPPARRGARPTAVIRAMRIPEARAAISDAVTARIVAGFEHDLRQRQGRNPSRELDSAADRNPGHDATRVPPVPAARLTIDYDSDRPEVLFTWKAEAGGAPDVLLRVPTGWQRDVAHRGHAVLGGYPVLQVLERDADGRPSEISVAVIIAHFDPRLHGWRAWGQAGTRDVTWAADGTPRVIVSERSTVW